MVLVLCVIVDSFKDVPIDTEDLKDFFATSGDCKTEIPEELKEWDSERSFAVLQVADNLLETIYCSKGNVTLKFQEKKRFLETVEAHNTSGAKHVGAIYEKHLITFVSESDEDVAQTAETCEVISIPTSTLIFIYMQPFTNTSTPPSTSSLPTSSKKRKPQITKVTSSKKPKKSKSPTSDSLKNLSDYALQLTPPTSPPHKTIMKPPVIAQPVLPNPMLVTSVLERAKNGQWPYLKEQQGGDVSIQPKGMVGAGSAGGQVC